MNDFDLQSLTAVGIAAALAAIAAVLRKLKAGLAGEKAMEPARRQIPLDSH
jgi:hypothetical protein